MRIVPWRHGTCVTTMPWHVATLLQQCCNIVATIVATVATVATMLQQCYNNAMASAMAFAMALVLQLQFTIVL